MPPPLRDARRHQHTDDQRAFGQRDRDRVLYTAAFRRLAGVTQVVGPEEGHIFHNRLTHTLEVAQIARRLAERLKGDQAALADHWGGINEDVVEAAALAHDLGHPPFGHVAEEELDKQVMSKGVAEGYEGNSQSFRILTKLSTRSEGGPGLNLSRATLRATLKYPWFRSSEQDSYEHKKYGAYQTESDDFRFAVEGCAQPRYPCLEAQIMTLADDIAYSVHDTEDFYRAGLIPLDRLLTNEDEVSRFISWVFERIDGKEIKSPFLKDDLEKTFSSFCRDLISVDEPYSGTRTHRAKLRRFTSGQIGRYLMSAKIREEIGQKGELLDLKEAKARRVPGGRRSFF